MILELLEHAVNSKNSCQQKSTQENFYSCFLFCAYVCDQDKWTVIQDWQIVPRLKNLCD
jgi:hypothetical protein